MTLGVKTTTAGTSCHARCAQRTSIDVSPRVACVAVCSSAFHSLAEVVKSSLYLGAISCTVDTHNEPCHCVFPGLDPGRKPAVRADERLHGTVTWVGDSTMRHSADMWAAITHGASRVPALTRLLTAVAEEQRATACAAGGDAATARSLASIFERHLDDGAGNLPTAVSAQLSSATRQLRSYKQRDGTRSSVYQADNGPIHNGSWHRHSSRRGLRAARGSPLWDGCCPPEYKPVAVGGSGGASGDAGTARHHVAVYNLGFHLLGGWLDHYAWMRSPEGMFLTGGRQWTYPKGITRWADEHILWPPPLNNTRAYGQLANAAVATLRTRGFGSVVLRSTNVLNEQVLQGEFRTRLDACNSNGTFGNGVSLTRVPWAERPVRPECMAYVHACAAYVASLHHDCCGVSTSADAAAATCDALPMNRAGSLRLNRIAARHAAPRRAAAPGFSAGAAGLSAAATVTAAGDDVVAFDGFLDGGAITGLHPQFTPALDGRHFRALGVLDARLLADMVPLLIAAAEERGPRGEVSGGV